MKHYYTRTLMLLLALTWLVPKANAQVSLSSTTPVAKCSTSAWSGTSGNLTAQIAVSNDVVYTIMTGGTLISYWNASNGQTGSFPNGSTLVLMVLVFVPTIMATLLLQVVLCIINV